MIEAPPAEGVCSRCHSLVPVGETYVHETTVGPERFHRAQHRRGGVPCGPVYTAFEYRLVWQVHDLLVLPLPLTSRDRVRALEARLEASIPAEPDRAAAPRVCLLIQELMDRS